MNPVWTAAASAWKPTDTRAPWLWCEDHYSVPVSSMPGKWRSSNSPWVKKLMEDFANNSIRQITVLCAAQSSKTETILALLCWLIAEDPSPTMWVTSSDEEALKFCNERLMPALRLCPPVAKQIPDERTLAKSMEILFPTMMLECVGANSKAKLQSRSRRFLLLDEVRNWPDWALPMVMKRPRTWWNSRVVILTTPEAEHDTVHMQFLEGSQNHYHVPCQNMDCGVRSEMDFKNLKAQHPVTHQCVKWSEVPGALDEDHKWNLELLAPHIRYMCPVCGYMHSDRPQTRRRMATEGRWVPYNEKAPPHLVSYTWSALLPPWVRWRSIVEEFLKAQNALEFGNHEPLKSFITETLGLPWQDKLRFARTEGYIDDRVTDFTKPFAEARRFLSIDVQGKGGRHFFWSVHAFAQGGAQRVIAFGKAWSIEELRSLMTDHKVESTNVLIDSGKWAAEVYSYVMESGVLPSGDFAWKVCKGDKASHYLVEGVRQPFIWSYVDPYLGQRAPNQKQTRPIRQLLFSKSALLDRAELIMRGSGPSLELPVDANMLHEYKNQLCAYERVEKVATNGEVQTDWIQKRNEDHWGSCFRMALVGGYASGLMDAQSI